MNGTSITKLLSLDLSLSTGWCVVELSDTPTYRSGKWKLKNTDPISRLIDLRSRIQEVVIKEEIDTIVFERVDFSKFVMAHASYNQLLAALYLYAEANGIDLYGIPVGVIKKVSTGKGNAKKELMVAEANKLWPTEHFDTKENNDEVDARLLAKYAYDSLSNKLLAAVFKDKYNIRKAKEKPKNKNKSKKKESTINET